MSDAAKTDALLKEVDGFIRQSRELLQQGAIMELSGLDQQVETLCKEILQLSQDERIRYSEELQRLFEELTRLGDTLAEHRDRIADEIQGLSHHKKASTAYRSTVQPEKPKTGGSE